VLADINQGGESITFANISKRYGAVVAIDGVSIEVEAGEFVSLLGPSGSGKTTMLMMLAGFEQPSEGQMKIGERDVTHVPPNRRDIGVVFQRYALFPHLTVGQNIGFPLKMRNLPKAEIRRRVADALGLVRLEGYEARLPNQLSGGQQQRVAVARALVFNPSVLLMDEPLGALDKKLRTHMQAEIRRIQRSVGVTMIYVTHDQDEAFTMSDRVAVIHEGRLAQIGSPIDLYRAPATPFVADFVGQMNFLDGVMRGRQGENVALELSSGNIVEAVAPPNLRALVVGRNYRAAIRPEQFGLSESGSSRGPVLRGRIESVVFFGALRVFQIRVGAEEISVQSLAGGRAAAFAAGDEVDVTYSAADVLLFPEA
jgi:mannopine transport system ATP-binding protein